MLNKIVRDKKSKFGFTTNEIHCVVEKCILTSLFSCTFGIIDIWFFDAQLLSATLKIQKNFIFKTPLKV